MRAVHEFRVLSANRAVGETGSFDSASIALGKRAYEIAEIIAIVVNDPRARKRGWGHALKPAGGAALGAIAGKALPFGGGVIGAALGAGATALATDKPKTTQTALVFADGLVAIVETDEVSAGALMMLGEAVAAHHAHWGAPNPKALPAPDQRSLISAEKLIASLPSRDDIAETTRRAVESLRSIDWPEIPNPFRKRPGGG